MNCPCGGELTEGFIPDFGLLAVWTSCWVPGSPDTNKSWLDRLKTGGGVQMAGANALMVEAWRCQSCGLLQLYANRPAPEGTSPA